MYLKKDYYLSEYRKELNSDKEVVEFIKNAFPGVEEIEIQGSVSLYLFSFFGYALYPFSVNVLTSNLGPYFGSVQLRNRLSRHVTHDLMRTYSFTRGKCDMDCRSAYYVPSKRHSEISATLPAFLKSSLKLRRCGGKVPGHDYGVGISILQYMLLGKPFEVIKEVTYAGTEMKSRGSLCVDAQIRFYDGDYNIYLEQDMGTESHRELVNKIYLYNKHGLTRGRSYVVFSSHEIEKYLSCVTFSKPKMELLYDALMKEEAHSLGQYEELYLEDAEAEIKDLFTRLAVRVNYYYAFEKGDESKRIDAKNIDENTTIIRNVAGSDFTVEELRRYIDELADGNNPYRQRLYNIRQMLKASYKFKGMCNLLCNSIHEGYFKALEVEAVINHGLSCLVYPSVLLSRSYDYMEYRMRDVVEGVIEKYYPGIKDFVYSYNSPYIDIEGHPHCLLHNCYATDNGSYLCVEHIGYDVGAFCRFYYMYLNYEHLEVPLHLVALVENEEEILNFARMSGFYTTCTSIKNEAFFLSFLNLNDRERHLCTVHKSEKYGYRVMHLSTPDEIEAIARQMR